MSSLIVLGIVAIWILVLVPMWLNRHDADNASRSMDTFSTAMRVLSHRTPARSDRRYLVLSRREGVTVDNQPDAFTGRRLPAFSRRASAPRGRARLVARRRRIALAFALLLIGLAVSAVVAETSWWLELAAGLALAGYVIHLRNEAIRAEELRRRRMSRSARAAAASSYSRGTVRESTVRRELDATFEPAIVDGLVAVVPASASGTENGSRWEPVPVPLPTYVSKPVVARPTTAAPRADAESGPIIDLTRPGTWSEEVDVRHLLLDESTSAPRPRAAVESDDDELDVILERRRAVND
jgi:hypothetical protein